MPGRAERASRRVWTWVRAPFRLLRFPGILVAVAGAGLVLAVAGASAPLFVSAAGAAALADRIGTTSSQFAGLRVTSTTPISADRLRFRQQLATDAVRGLGLGAPEATVIGTNALLIDPRTGDSTSVEMATKQGFLPHIRRVSGGGTNGFWIARTVAQAIHARPGSRVLVQLGAVTVPVRVAGIYQDFIDVPLPTFWQSMRTIILPPDPDAPIPPPFLLGDVAPFVSLEGRLLDTGTIEFDFPLAGDVNLAEARAVAAGMSELKASTFDPTSPLSGPFDTIDSGLPTLVQLADSTVAATTQPVQAISLAGRLVALVLVAVAGVYAVRRRRVEIELLSARGLGPFLLGTRSAVESVLPVAVGAVAGWWLAILLVRALGPTVHGFDAAALRSSVAQAALSIAAGIVLFGIAAGASTRNEARERPGRLRDAASRWPWEIAALALAGASLYEILSRGTGSTTSAGQPPKFDLLILMFPFLFVAGTAGLVVRWLRGRLPRLRKIGTRPGTSVGVYLSTSRLASAPRLATSLVTASALAIGILVYAGVLATSIEATANEKASLSIGSDVAVTVGSTPTVLGHPSFAWTPIERLDSVGTSPDSGEVELILIDPKTFADTAYWNHRLGPSLKGMMADLDSESWPLPVVLAGPAARSGLQMVIAGQAVPLRVVAHVKQFPGAVRGKLTLVADRASVINTVNGLEGEEQRFELWAKGDPARILPFLGGQGFPMDLAISVTTVRSTPAFLALSWTFGLLEAFGILAGLITILGIVLYLQARQQAREVSYALARRMGLRRRAHRRSVLVELLAMLLTAFALGAAFSTVAAALVHARLDPIPNLSPGPFIQLPSLLFAATAAGIIVVCALGARLVQRRADHTNVAEVMRLAG